MPDDHLRELEERWRAAESWEDWERWALAARRHGDADPHRLLRALERTRVLTVRRTRLGRLRRELDAPLEDRWDWLNNRTGVAYEAALRRAALLGRNVPHPDPESAADWRNSLIRIALAGREALRAARPLREGPRTSFVSQAPRVAFTRGRQLSPADLERLRDALEETRNTGRMTVLNLEVGDVEILEGQIRDPEAVSAFAEAVAREEREHGIVDREVARSAAEERRSHPCVTCGRSRDEHPVDEQAGPIGLREHAGSARVCPTGWMPWMDQVDAVVDSRPVRYRCPHCQGADPGLLLGSLRAHFRRHDLERCSSRGCPQPAPPSRAELPGLEPFCDDCFSVERMHA